MLKKKIRRKISESIKKKKKNFGAFPVIFLGYLSRQRWYGSFSRQPEFALS